MENFKASDLRIGNLVTDSSGFICEIREIRSGTVKVKYHSDKDIYCFKSFSEIFSIPLTEERLFEFGFNKKTGLISGKSFYEDKHIIIDFSNGSFIYLNKVILNVSPPKSVHQIQNLYYALTGEEL